jgi:hypothetical protein
MNIEQQSIQLLRIILGIMTFFNEASAQSADVRKLMVDEMAERNGFLHRVQLDTQRLFEKRPVRVEQSIQNFKCFDHQVTVMVVGQVKESLATVMSAIKVGI